MTYERRNDPVTGEPVNDDTHVVERETYVERESELEEILLRDKIDNYELTDANERETKLTQARWQSYVRRSKEYEGWASSLGAEFGSDLVRFLEESQILDEDVSSLDDARKLLGKKSRESGSSAMSRR